MNPAGDRRQDSRRDEDKLVDYRLEQIEATLKNFEVTLQGLGSASGHLALLDARSDDNARRITLLEKGQAAMDNSLTDIKIALEGVRVRVSVAAAVGSLVGAGVVALLVKFAGG